LSDSKRFLYLYFAHLQTQNIEAGAYVETGDVIGTVGNTGNAKSTPPHLHFGIYASGYGPVDPHHFITRTKDVPPSVLANLKTLGEWVRSKVPSVSLRSSMGNRSEKLASLEKYSVMKVMAAAKNLYRVLLPDGKTGYVPEGGVETVTESLRNQQSDLLLALRDTPGEGAAAKGWIEAGNEYSILGKFREYWMVRTQQGGLGWLQVPSTSVTETF
jgi:hypothetical protein